MPNLIRYNEYNLVEKRKQFFNNRAAYDKYSYSDLLYYLNYNFDKNDENFKFGKRFIRKDGSFGWITSNNRKEITQWYFNQMYKIMMPAVVQAGCSWEDLENHVIGSKRPNTKLKLKKEYMTSEYENTRINLYNINNKTFGLTMGLPTKVLWFDIDNHEGIYNVSPDVEKLLKFLGCQPTDAILIEQNQFNGGYHIFVQLSYFIRNPEFFNDLTKLLKDTGFHNIDCNFYNRILRFPLSYEYLPIDKAKFDPNKKWQKTYDSLDDMYKHTNFARVIECPEINKIVQANGYGDKIDYFNHEFQPIDTNINKPHDIEFKKAKTRNTASYNFWHTKRVIINPKNKKFSSNIDSFRITSGNRYDTFSIMIPYCVNTLNYSLDETVRYLMTHCDSSKDMAKWGYDGIKKNITNYYNQCKKYKRVNHFDSFVSNQHHIPTNLFNMLNDKSVESIYVKWIEDEILKARHYSFTWSQSKLHNLSIQLPYILKEVIGTYYYQTNNLTDKLNRYTNYKYKSVNGFQLSDTHLKKIIEQSRLLDGIEYDNSTINVQYLKKAILNILKLTPFHLKGKYDWSKGFCRSFVANYNSIFNFYVRLLYRCQQYIRNIKSIYQNLYLYINNYISILKNQTHREEYTKILDFVNSLVGYDPPPI